MYIVFFNRVHAIVSTFTVHADSKTHETLGPPLLKIFDPEEGADTVGYLWTQSKLVLVRTQSGRPRI
jgi:hypothetical protein